MSPAFSADLSAVTWRKSTRSSGGGSNCVEVARQPGRIIIRDSKNPHGAMLIFTPATFERLIHGIKRDGFRP